MKLAYAERSALHAAPDSSGDIVRCRTSSGRAPVRRRPSVPCDRAAARRPRRRRLSRRRPGAGRRRRPRGSRGRAATRSSTSRTTRCATASAYVTRLADMGAPVDADRVVSSARATALYLRDHEPAVRRVLAVGAGGLERELRDAGLRGHRRPPTRRRASGRRAIDGLRGGRRARRGRRRARPAADVPPHRRRRRLHPGRRPLHRHEPRPDLPDRARPAAGRGSGRRGDRGRRPGVDAGRRSASRRRCLLEEAARAVGRDARDAVMIGDGS